MLQLANSSLGIQIRIGTWITRAANRISDTVVETNSRARSKIVPERLSMEKNDFVGYVGSADLHDARVTSILRSGSAAEVRLVAHNGREIKVCFSGVKNLIADKPEGMMIYGLTELKAESPYRRFAFTNWDEDDKRSLEILARDLKVE
jgi:hypothetical protein